MCTKARPHQMAEHGDFDILLDKRNYRRTAETIS